MKIRLLGNIFQTLWTTQKLTISATSKRQNNSDRTRKWKKRRKRRKKVYFWRTITYGAIILAMIFEKKAASLYLCLLIFINQLSRQMVKSSEKSNSSWPLSYITPKKRRPRPFTIIFPYLVFAVTATLNDKVKSLFFLLDFPILSM